MNLFTKDGHVTKDALQALMAETLDEENRFDVAEHLSFCDKCLDTYTAMLAEDDLAAPPAEIAPGVMQRIRQRAQRIFYSRTVRVAAAVVLAVGLWAGGAFNLMPTAHSPQATPPTAAHSTAAGDKVTEKLSSFLGDITSGINQALEQISLSARSNSSQSNSQGEINHE